jgi:hypothetical protein
VVQAKRQYNNNYPSVTQVLDVLRKPGLEAWFKYNTIQFINNETTKGKEIGTIIHQAIQDHIELREVKVDTMYPDEVMNALKAFMQFKKDHPEFKLRRSEMMLTSEVHKYNGTLDCEAERDGELLIADWKTSKVKDKDYPDIYDEYIYQVAAYVAAYNEINKTTINRAIIVSLAKDKPVYNYMEIDSTKLKGGFEEVFLPALQIYNYQRKKNG